MSLRAEIDDLAVSIEKEVVGSAVSAAERNRILAFVRGLVNALDASDDPAVHAEPEAKPAKRADPEASAKPKGEK